MRQPGCPKCGQPLPASEDGAPALCPHCNPRYPSDAETKTSLGGPPAPPAEDYRGRNFGKYEIVEEISRGAMGVVYKAREPMTDRIVALKVLLAGELASGSQVERFRREVQAAARLRHAAIVPIHDVGVSDEKHYYTMDYIEGRPLSALIAGGEVSIRRALEIAKDVAEALDYAHGQGVVHRDIKPSNILVDPAGQVHLMDFGLAKLVDSDSRFTRTGTTIGTPSYMPPEQASGESHRVDHRADIYSLGAVLYELLAGRPPFSGDTMMNTLMQVLNEDPVPPKRLNPRIHTDIQTIVLKAMEKDPDRRYLSARAFADDVQHFIAGESILARPASVSYRCWKWLKRHRSEGFAAAAVVVVLLAAYASYLQLREETVQQVEQAREEGRIEGTKDAEARQREEEQPALKIVFSDEFDRQQADGQWVVEGGAWRLTGGQFRVAAAPSAAVRTAKKFTGNVTVIFDFVLPPGGKPAAGQAAGAVGCFLGADGRHGYRVLLGSESPSRLVLWDEREEVAGVECPALEADRPYRVTLRRSSMGLRVGVERPGGEMRRELAYNDVRLPVHLGREFAAGLLAERARLHVERFRVEQEFVPLKTSPLQAPEELVRVGNFFEARSLYEQIAQGHEGRYEGLAALVGMALCEEAQGNPAAALKHLQSVEARGARIEHEQLPGLLAQSRLHRFFCGASVRNFGEAAQALRRLVETEGQVDPGWAWQFPACVAALLEQRAYEEVLGVLRARLFGPNRQTLHGVATALRAPALESALAKRARELAEAFCETGHCERVQEVYAACPTPLLADAFARATEEAVRRDQRDEALALLAFCTEHRMASPRLTQAAVELAKAFCDSEFDTRLVDLYEAFPDRQLAPLFTRAIAETTAAGRLDDALALLRQSVESFPAEARAFLGSEGAAARLGRAFVARGDLLRPIELHKALGEAGGDPAVVSLFVEAIQAALSAKQADAALQLLGYGRAHFGAAHAGLGAAAVRLVGQLAADGDYRKVLAAQEAYPSAALAPALGKAMSEAVAAGRLAEALAIFTPSARSGYELPAGFVPALAAALAARDPAEGDTKALVEQYQGVQKLTGKPAVGAAMALALGDAYVGAGRLLPALAQYEAVGGLDGLLRAGCVAAELGLGERALALWADLREQAQPSAEWTAIAAFLLGAAGTADLERGASGAQLSAAAVAYLRGLRLWLTGASGSEQEFAVAARGKPEWFTPLAKRDRP